MTANRMNQAMTLAREYASRAGMGRNAEAQEARRTIEELVGYYDAGNVFRLPREVEQAMGLDPWDAHGTSTWRQQR